MALALLLLRLWGASLRSWRVEERERGAKSLNYLHFERLNPSLRHLTALACGTAAAHTAHIERVNFALNFTRGIKAEVHWGGCNIKYVRRKTMGFGFSGVCFFLLEFWMKIEIISVSFFLQTFPLSHYTIIFFFFSSVGPFRLHFLFANVFFLLRALTRTWNLRAHAPHFRSATVTSVGSERELFGARRDHNLNILEY